MTGPANRNHMGQVPSPGIGLEELNPDNWAAHYNLGFTLAAAGKSDEAIAAYRRSIGLRPKRGASVQFPRIILRGIPRYPLAASAITAMSRWAGVTLSSFMMGMGVESSTMPSREQSKRNRTS